MIESAAGAEYFDTVVTKGKRFGVPCLFKRSFAVCARKVLRARARAWKAWTERRNAAAKS